MSNVDGWSSSRYWGFIRSALRKAWSKYPNKFKALKMAERPSKRGGRTKYEYICATCSNWFLQKEVSVDHIVDCGKLSGFEDLAEFVSNLYCKVDGLQVLCSDCHDIKTYATRYDMTLEQAENMKKVINKLKQKVDIQKKELTKLGYPSSMITNADNRRKCYLEHITGERV